MLEFENIKTLKSNKELLTLLNRVRLNIIKNTI